MCLWKCPSRTRARATSLSISSCRETWKRVLRERESGAEEQSVFDKSSCPYAQMHNTDGNMCARMPDRTTKFSSPCSRNRSQAKQQPKHAAALVLGDKQERRRCRRRRLARPARDGSSFVSSTASKSHRPCCTCSAFPLPRARVSAAAAAARWVGVGLHCCVAWRGQGRWGWSGAWWTRR